MPGLSLTPIDLLGIGVMLGADVYVMVLAARPGSSKRERYQALGIVAVMPIAGLLTGQWILAALFAGIGAWNLSQRRTSA